MTPPESIASDRRETSRLGDWRIRSTAVVRSSKHRPWQVALLFPPPGFAGSARLSVIAAGRRDEFAQVWTPGETLPLLFSIPVADPAVDAIVRADLLLEISKTERASEVLAGEVVFRRTTEEAWIHLAPMLSAPEDAVAGASDANAWLEALARDATVRLVLSADRLDALSGGSARERARSLIGSGRLEIVEPPRARIPPPAGSGFPPPFPLRTHIATEMPPPGPAELAASVRALLLLGAEAADWAGGLHPVLREMPFRIVGPERSVLACVVPAPCLLDPHARPDGPRAALTLDRMLLASPPAEPIELPHRGPAAVRVVPEPRAPGFCALPLGDTRELHALAGFVREWNRRHATPKLQLVTPADHFALLEELEARGTIAVPQLRQS